MRPDWRLLRSPLAALWVLALLTPACGDGGPTGAEPDPRTITVEVVDFAYVPARVEARVGDTVRWIQRDSAPHTVTTSDPFPTSPGGFDLPLDRPGDVVEVTLTRTGLVDYFCRPHPFMTGSLRVSSS
ncbi:MAG: plastocyanin/azurin family copper-binding protein [Gemmatimonadota bacterium]